MQIELLEDSRFTLNEEKEKSNEEDFKNFCDLLSNKIK